jgi:chondroitin AC lyase
MSGKFRLQATVFILFFPIVQPVLSQTTTAEKSIQTLTARLFARSLCNTEQKTSSYNNIQADGSWADIDYRDSLTARWMLHVQRLRFMAAAYNDTAGAGYLSADLLAKIDKGFAFIHDKHFRSSNWWDSVIGAPNDYMAALILMKAHFEKEQVKKYASYLADATANQAHKGQNRVWVSIITIYKGCITGDTALVKKGYASIASTLTIEHVQGNEGIKADHSFHQHRPQLYSGGYGLEYVRDVAEMLALSRQTIFAGLFTPGQLSILSGLALKGHQLLEYRDVVDFGTIGRNISRENGLNGMDTGTLNNLLLIDAAHAPDYMQWKSHLTGAAFPKAYRGNNYFWKSDIMTHHGSDYYLSAKVISTRTAGTEMLNGENGKGFNLPLGATNIMTHGSEYRNIFPVWDWTKVPGVTAVNNPSSVLLQWYLYGSNQFAGGASDGPAGLIAYEHSYNGVQAKKAYFFMGDAMLCLGAGINALGIQQVHTTLNQAFLKGEVTIHNRNKTEPMNESLKLFNDLQWVYHDGVGYVFPEAAPVIIRRAAQQGSWKSINTGGSNEQITKDVFSLWFVHGTAPVDAHYQYMVVPAASKEALVASKVPGKFRVVSNTADIQAVCYDDHYAIVFYEPGSVVMPDGVTISSKVKATVLIRHTSAGYHITAADPVHKQPALLLLLNKKLQGAGIVRQGNNSLITIPFPTGDNTGNTVSRFYKNPS